MNQADASGDESSYIRGTEKPFVITDGKRISPRGRRDLAGHFGASESHDERSQSDFVDRSASNDDLPLEFRSSENVPRDLPHFKKVESETPGSKSHGSGAFILPPPKDEHRYGDQLNIHDAMTRMLNHQNSSDWRTGSKSGKEYTSHTQSDSDYTTDHSNVQNQNRERMTNPF